MLKFGQALAVHDMVDSTIFLHTVTKLPTFSFQKKAGT